MEMESSSTCPFCNVLVRDTELQWHANSHFEDEDEDEQFARDRELAHEIASSSNSGDGDCPINDKISCLVALQTRSSFYCIKDGLMSLLTRCLERDQDSSVTILSGYIDHFQSTASEDRGWGCGWRNIQMMSSHLLAHRPEAREVLFGGSGFVPDIPFLQRWLEIAWEKGFDAVGSHHFNNRVYGSTHRIGTTECVALFRSFGLRARVVDFGPQELRSLYLSVPGSGAGPSVVKGKSIQVSGPMDRYVVHLPNSNKSRESENTLGNGSDNLEHNSTKQNQRHQNLIDWVWNYFSDKGLKISNSSPVIVSDRTPLYFQHDGHSRTIVGIQVKHQHNRMQQFSLLILDPGHRTAALERSLKENFEWKTHLKRGVHTLRKRQYQLCYIDPGIAGEEEMEQLKTIDSVFIEL
ncbi:hypothetical protein SLA2020_156300 [Shorea laevis]